VSVKGWSAQQQPRGLNEDRISERLAYEKRCLCIAFDDAVEVPSARIVATFRCDLLLVCLSSMNGLAYRWN
jgi:hypothetical protein